MKSKRIGIICYPGLELDKIIAACKDEHLDYKIIDFFSTDWLEQCTPDIQGYLVRPPCIYQEHKSIFDERVYYINHVLKKKTYPSFSEIYTYENKRNMHLFLSGYNIPHAKTVVFLDKKNALNHSKEINYPVIYKSNIGAGGSVVKVIENKRQFENIAHSIFGRLSPELSIGWFPYIKYKNIPLPRLGRATKHYMLIQEFLKIKWEWRMIRIGNSYFGHQKLLGDNGFASGSELVGWEMPSNELLALLHNTTENMNMRCMVLDIFETENGEYFVNEMQSIIGAYRPYQMKVNGVPGRYIYKDNSFVFEEGIHCQNACWNLRVKDFSDILDAEG
ncbi:hypothetical protein [Symbiopectobacterium purcellii]|uniref:ATP-grasp domain-containing protein n=1 Tax=Symbiopectobacterium purcellii TaxID=2871826 RepID=A0ABX9AVR7_9ENTR|nr:hypothetical protein [Symbiopectobacterium purcellii]QZN97070.1 hypothetical protein K6K13_06755 [Symbiopectobacterium purcellii]